MMGDKLLRLKDVLTLVPVGKSSWWKGVKEGRFPKPIKLGPRTTCWRYSDIIALMEGKAKEVGDTDNAS